MAAPGADVFFDADYTAGLTKDGSEKVSAWLSRIGGYTVEEASGPNQPTWGATSPTGRRGITFSVADSTRLIDPNTTLGLLYTGTQAMSSLVVLKYASHATTQIAWSIATGQTTYADTIRESPNVTTGVDRRIRSALAGTTVSTGSQALGTSLAISTMTYDGSVINSWVNRTLSVNASANTRAPATGRFMVGCGVTTADAPTGFFGGEIYGLILSRSVWTTAQRQALEAAAAAYWGSP